MKIDYELVERLRQSDEALHHDAADELEKIQGEWAVFDEIGRKQTKRMAELNAKVSQLYRIVDRLDGLLQSYESERKEVGK